MCAICPDHEKHNAYCPIHQAAICHKHCKVCEYHRRETDPSNVRCRYWVGRKKESPIGPDQLQTMIYHKGRLLERLYKQGKTRAAESVEKEIGELKRKKRRLEDEAGNL